MVTSTRRDALDVNGTLALLSTLRIGLMECNSAVYQNLRNHRTHTNEKNHSLGLVSTISVFRLIIDYGRTFQRRRRVRKIHIEIKVRLLSTVQHNNDNSQNIYH